MFGMNIRDRVIDQLKVPASSLRPSPVNWRTHPIQQRDALRGVLAEIGFAGAELVRRCEDGTLELIDGHLRAEEMGDQLIPVTVTDLTEEEAKKLLVIYDPIGDLAGADADRPHAVDQFHAAEDRARREIVPGGQVAAEPTFPFPRRPAVVTQPRLRGVNQERTAVGRHPGAVLDRLPEMQDRVRPRLMDRQGKHDRIPSMKPNETAHCPKCNRRLPATGEVAIDRKTFQTFQCDECIVETVFYGQKLELPLTFCIGADGKAFTPEGLLPQ